MREIAIACAVLYIVLSCLMTSACHSNSPSTAGASAARGKTIYQTQCIACHNSNPKKPGTLGPEVFGSSRALIESRVVHATYPPGHTPKRATHMMTPLPHLKNEIDSLHLYLNEMK